MTSRSDLKGRLVCAGLVSILWLAVVGYIVAAGQREVDDLTAEAKTLRDTLDAERDRKQVAEEVLTLIFREPWSPERVMIDEIRVSAYSSTPDQTDSNPWKTSTGKHVEPGGAAITDDMGIPYGKRVLIVDGPLLTIDDRKPGVKGIDMWVTDKETARHVGRRWRTAIWLGE